MTGKEIVAEAAKRAAEKCILATGDYDYESLVLDDNSESVLAVSAEFAPYAELRDAVRELIDNCPNCRLMRSCHRHIRTKAALADVEKLGGE